MTPSSQPSDLFIDDPGIQETLEIEHRLREAGYSSLPHVLELGGDFDYEGSTVEAVVSEARTYLRHQQSVELSGARILAAIGELAVKAAAFDAIAALVTDRRQVRQSPSPPDR